MYSLRGKSYKSASAIAEAFSVSVKKFNWRIGNGWSLEEALELAQRKKPRAKIAVLGDKMFYSQRELALHFNISEGKLNQRIRQGWSVEQAVGLDRPPNRNLGNPKPCQFLGRKFASKRERNEFYGLKHESQDVIEKRLARGWTKRQAAELDPAPPRFRDKKGSKRQHVWKSVEEIDGKYYPKIGRGNYKLYVITNIINHKQYIGITISELDARWRGHCSAAKAEAFTTKLSRAIRKYGKHNFKIELIKNDAKNFQELAQQEIDEIKKRGTISDGYNISAGGSLAGVKPIVVDGILYGSRAAAAEAFGIPQSKFNHRLKVGKSPEQAAEIAKREKYERVRINTKYGSWPSLKSACIELELKYGTIHRRVNTLGWSFEQALGFENPTNSKQMIKPVSVNGKTFPSQAAFARYLKVHYSTMTQLLKTKSPEEIIEIYSS